MSQNNINRNIFTTNELRSCGPTHLMNISSMQYTEIVKFLKSILHVSLLSYYGSLDAMYSCGQLLFCKNSLFLFSSRIILKLLTIYMSRLKLEALYQQEVTLQVTNFVKVFIFEVTPVNNVLHPIITNYHELSRKYHQNQISTYPNSPNLAILITCPVQF